MKCINCNCCHRGWFSYAPDAYVCTGVKEPFVISDINAECPEYPERRNAATIEDAIAHYKYGITHDIFSEPVTSYSKMAVSALSKLRYYENLNEQGRLITLPCKVGDTVYTIENVFNGKEVVRMIGSRKIDGIGGNHLNPVWMVSRDPYEIRYHPSEFGRTVFLTREEAEDVLRGNDI